MFIQTSFSVAQAKVPHERSSDAGSFIALAQNFGIVMALAISGAVFQNSAVKNLRHLLPTVPEYQVKQAISGAGNALFKTLPPDVARQTLDVIVGSISKTCQWEIFFPAVLVQAFTLFVLPLPSYPNGNTSNPSRSGAYDSNFYPTVDPRPQSKCANTWPTDILVITAGAVAVCGSLFLSVSGSWVRLVQPLTGRIARAFVPPRWCCWCLNSPS